MVTLAPASASASATVAPMPLPPPVTSARLLARRAISYRRCGRLAAAGEPIELIAAGVIWRRPGFAVVAEPSGGMERPVRIGKMRPRETHEIGAAGHQDRVDVIRLKDVPDRHGRHAGLVADAVGERRLEHAAVDRLGGDRGLAGRHVADVDAGLLQQPADADRVARLDAVGADPVVGGNAHGYWFFRRPH